MATLDLDQLSKRNNFNTFLTRIRTGKDFTLAESNGVKVKLDKSILKELTSITHFDKFRDNKRSILLPTITGQYIRLRQIYKDSEFGGIPMARGVADEIEQMNRINSQLNKIFDELGVDHIPLQVGRHIYDVAFCERLVGKGKCDLHFKLSNGTYGGHISYKKSIKSADFLQWSGTSEREEPRIFKYPETQRFIKYLKDTFPNGVPRGTSIGKKMVDDNNNLIKKIAVYGSDYDPKKKPKRTHGRKKRRCCNAGNFRH